MAGGILFGPWVGIATGVIAGLHRFLIDVHGVTSVPCLVTSIIAGIVAGESTVGCSANGAGW